MHEASCKRRQNVGKGDSGGSNPAVLRACQSRSRISTHPSPGTRCLAGLQVRCHLKWRLADASWSLTHVLSPKFVASLPRCLQCGQSERSAASSAGMASLRPLYLSWDRLLAVEPTTKLVACCCRSQYLAKHSGEWSGFGLRLLPSSNHIYCKDLEEQARSVRRSRKPTMVRCVFRLTSAFGYRLCNDRQ
jgi:hypothetical protein